MREAQHEVSAQDDDGSIMIALSKRKRRGAARR